MYRLRRTNGEFYASIAPNIILGPNTPSANPAPINLIGRNKVSYGEAQNENFLWLTENFSSKGIPPVSSVKGQLWYDYDNDDGTGSGGELKIAASDSTTKWLTVPVIAETNTEPSRSNTGRIIIYKKDRLKIRMNDSWHTIITEVPQDKLFSALLTPIYNDDIVDGQYTTALLTASSDYAIATFNEGGYLRQDGSIGGTEEGVLKYGSVYQWEADVIARSAIDVNIYKIWKIKGSFTVDKESVQTSPKDPRKITQFNRNSLVYDVVTQHPDASTWDVYARASTNIPGPTINNADILDGDYYGLQFVGNAGKLSGTINMQWSVMLRMTGIPSSTHPKYA